MKIEQKFRYSEEKYRPALMEMWRLCFPNDSDKFIEFYFNNVYRDEETLLLIENNVPVASLQVIPYQIKTGNKIFDAGYISGAMTHPDFRRKGYMEQLLYFAFSEMQKKNIPVSFLIPQEDWLYGFYTKYGYEKAFLSYSKETYFADSEGNKLKIGNDLKIYRKLEDIDLEVVYPLYSKFLNQIERVVLKSRQQFANILKDLFLDNDGIVFAGEEGIALAIIEEGHIRLKEFFYTDLESRNHILAFISGYLSKNEIIIQNNQSLPELGHSGMLKPLDHTINLTKDIYMGMMLN